MANSKVGNYQLEFTLSGFTSPFREHTHSIWVAPTTFLSAGVDPDDVDLQLKGGGTKTLQESADQYSSFLRNMYASAISVSAFQLWRWDTEYQRNFMSAGLAVPTTSGTGSVTEAGEQIVTMRCAGGAIQKIVMIENNITGNGRIPAVPNASGTSTQRLVAFLLSADGCAIGLDNTFPVAGLFDSRGQNEAIWRKIHRP